MKYKSQKLSFLEVLDLLIKAENSFTPPLSQNIPYTVEDYAERLSVNAIFVICFDNNEIVGFTAYYINTEKEFAYIPQIWVLDSYQNRGVGSSMIDEMVRSLPAGISSIRLEVRKNNIKALSFYKKCGYYVIEENDKKCTMEKNL